MLLEEIILEGQEKETEEVFLEVLETLEIQETEETAGKDF